MSRSFGLEDKGTLSGADILLVWCISWGPSARRRDWRRSAKQGKMMKGREDERVAGLVATQYVGHVVSHNYSTRKMSASHVLQRSHARPRPQRSAINLHNLETNARPTRSQPGTMGNTTSGEEGRHRLGYHVLRVNRSSHQPT